MTQEQIINMAREAGASFESASMGRQMHFAFSRAELECFAAMVGAKAAADEREARATLIEGATERSHPRKGHRPGLKEAAWHEAKRLDAHASGLSTGIAKALVEAMRPADASKQEMKGKAL